MIKYLSLLIFMLSTSAYAGWIAEQTKVIAVESTSGNTDTFTAIVRGGSGACVSLMGDNLIYFPHSEAATSDIHNRTYSMLLAALTSGAKVSIYNYADNSCQKAVGVRMINE
ncbi:DUF5992 family protein [Vibrio aquimaris]|uniref:Uncharacterized protein n=1 Tax=Vibrio aquimaris TaxID=2587862 RepID=A0A5P9CPT5_9VIBR|nr:DUF5992 family protein [Vibrio aquimaris]QFT28269.1 hypothetical protein FIV01_17905 [Vibrio aquimaris]